MKMIKKKKLTEISKENEEIKWRIKKKYPFQSLFDFISSVNRSNKINKITNWKSNKFLKFFNNKNQKFSGFVEQKPK